jgi:hypothetical protein
MEPFPEAEISSSVSWLVVALHWLVVALVYWLVTQLGSLVC